MPFCTACGTKINDTQKFCTNCGAQIRRKQVENTEAGAECPAVSTQQNPDQLNPQQLNPEQQNDQPPPVQMPVYGAAMTGVGADEINDLLKESSDFATYGKNISEKKMLANLEVVNKNRKKGIVLSVINSVLLVIQFLCTVLSFIFIEIGFHTGDIAVSIAVVAIALPLFILSIVGIVANKQAFNKPLQLVNFCSMVFSVLLAVVLLFF